MEKLLAESRPTTHNHHIEFKELSRYQAAQQQQSEQAPPDLPKLSEKLEPEF